MQWNQTLVSQLFHLPVKTSCYCGHKFTTSSNATFNDTYFEKKTGKCVSIIKPTCDTVGSQSDCTFGTDECRKVAKQLANVDSWNIDRETRQGAPSGCYIDSSTGEVRFNFGDGFDDRKHMIQRYPDNGELLIPRSESEGKCDSNHVCLCRLRIPISPNALQCKPNQFCVAPDTADTGTCMDNPPGVCFEVGGKYGGPGIDLIDNCNETSGLCKCVACNEGYFGSDCSPCPTSAIAGFGELLFLLVSMYFFFAISYIYYKREELQNLHELAMGLKEAPESASEQFNEAKVALTMPKVLIDGWQISSAMLRVYTWNPDIPLWMVSMLKVFTSFFTFDVTGTLSYPECGSGPPMDYLGRWWVGMLLPWFIGLLFLFLYICAKKMASRESGDGASAAAQVWSTAGKQIIFVLSFEIILSQSFRIMNCRAFPINNIESHYSCMQAGPWIVAWAVILCYGIGPSFVRCYKMRGNKSAIRAVYDDVVKITMIGITATSLGATRGVEQMIILMVTLVLNCCCACKLRQKESVAVIVVTIVNVCGASGSYWGGAIGNGSQMVFAFSLVCGCLGVLINAMKDTVKTVKAFAGFPEKFAEWKFGTLEKILLFPFYMICLLTKCCSCFKNKALNRSKKVYPKSQKNTEIDL